MIQSPPQAPPCTATVATDMSKALDTVNTHKVSNKLVHTNIEAGGSDIRLGVNSLRSSDAIYLW